MKIAICDDDEKCTDNVLRHLDYYSLRNNTEFDKYVFSSADKLLKSRVKFDIAVLDVEMQEQDGIKLGAELRKRLPHLILIYITAHRKYLDDALNLNAVRFFEKPLDSQRFYRGLTDALERIDNTTISFYLRDGKTIERIAAQDIIFVEIEKRKTKVVTEKRSFQSEQHISFWSDRLNASTFFSPHKSYIINFNYVTTYERDYVILNDKYKISIARGKQTEFHRNFMHFLEGK